MSRNNINFMPRYKISVRAATRRRKAIAIAGDDPDDLQPSRALSTPSVSTLSSLDRLPRGYSSNRAPSFCANVSADELRAKLDRFPESERGRAFSH